ncbi:hypothetical protein CHUAL_014080 [Chamberlinius hualienensis]
MRGKALKRQAQEIVSNVIRYFRSERENKATLSPLEYVYERTAAATGIDINVIDRYINNGQIKNGQETNCYDNDDGPPPAKLAKLSNSKPDLPSCNNLDDAAKLTIRRVIYNLHYSKCNPTVAQILDEIRRTGIEFSGGKSVLFKILKEIGYRLVKVGCHRYFQERHSITIARRQFLRNLRENSCSANSKVVVYVDETWINLETDNVGAKQPQPNTELDISEGKQSSSKKKSQLSGTGFIVIHAGTDKGYVHGAVELVKRGNRAGDNDENMNSLFEAWITKELIPSLVPNSIIVLDNAPYHCVPADRTPTISTPKSEIITWLRKHNISCSSEMLQSELLQLVKKFKPAKRYRIDELLEKNGHVVLHLPDFHSDLNPVEIIWAQAKKYYEDHKSRGEFNAISAEVVWKEALATITPERWAEAVQCVRSVQDDYWLKDCAIDLRNEAVDFPVYDDSSDDSDSDSESGRNFSIDS